MFGRLQETPGTDPPGFGLTTLASLLATGYGLGARARRALYASGCRQAQRLPAPVISVGNLAVGGTGKTPMVACLARECLSQGKRPVILSRGYGGSAQGVNRVSDGREIFLKPPEVGEEAFLLARQLPGVAVYTGPSRYDAGMRAWEELRPDLFLLDDGFQHFQLHRDLDIVLLDTESPFGNGRLLPRGPLREPLSALNAAQVIILTRFQAERHQARLKAIKEMFPKKTVMTATVNPTLARRYPGGAEETPASLMGLPVFAFAGLARPLVFGRTLAGLGVGLKGFRAFPDHHVFADTEIRDLLDEARTRGAGALITTAKDWARLGERWEGDLPLWVLEVEARLGGALPWPW